MEPFITPILFTERCLPIDRYKAQFNMHKLSSLHTVTNECFISLLH